MEGAVMKICERLAFSTLGCPAWGFGDVLRNAKAMGFSAIEVRGIGPHLQTGKIPAFMPENLGAAKAALEKNGLRVCGIGTSVTLHTGLDLQEGADAIRLADALGADFIRVFGDRFPAGERRPLVFDRVSAGLHTLCDAAEAGGNTSVLLEVHGEFNTIPALTELIGRVGKRPAFGLIWDIEHSFREYGNQVGEFYRLIAPYVRHVHVKDCVLENKEPMPTLLGHGAIDVPAVIAMLEKDRYAGYYSFEWEKRWIESIPEPEVAFPGYVAGMLDIQRALDLA
jgi:sugar phosphate isomerase/epimerase